MSTVRTVIAGCGGYLPERILTNDDLAKMVDTTDRWITERTGIKERRIAAEGELTSDMGAIVLGLGPRSGPATDNDIAGVDEVVA